MIVMLDTGPLGRASNPRASEYNLACYNWVKGLLVHGIPVFIPEICDYEVRRELLRAGKLQGIARLDVLKHTLHYLPLTTEVMLHAAQLWAMARQGGYPTADAQALDGDVILAAQASALNAIVATDNVGHLSRFVDARNWDTITVSAIE